MTGYVVNEHGLVLSNELAVEWEQLNNASPETNAEWAKWFEQLGEWWSKYDRQGYGNGKGSASNAFARAEQYRTKIKVDNRI